MSSEIGQALRAAREARGVALEDVERVTKIRARYLAAIEAGEWEVLPGRAYARGFLRTYADHLEVDPDPLLAELDRELGADGGPEEAPPEAVVQPGTLPRGLRRRGVLRVAAALLVAAAVVAAVALVVTGGDDPDPDELFLPPPPAAEEPTAEPEPVDPEPAEPEDVAVELEALGLVWVCLVDGAGNAHVDGETLAEGENRGPFEARRLLMTFGNGQIELTIDGDPVEVPDPGEPLGYEVTADAVGELGEDDRPTCS